MSVTVHSEPAFPNHAPIPYNELRADSASCTSEFLLYGCQLLMGVAGALEHQIAPCQTEHGDAYEDNQRNHKRLILPGGLVLPLRTVL